MKTKKINYFTTLWRFIDLVYTKNYFKGKPDEIYNLAAQSHVAVSFELPEYTTDVNASGALRILECIRFLGLKKTRFYQAGTSEMFGKVMEIPQKESTPFYPRSSYGVAKVFAYWITKIIEKHMVCLQQTEYCLIMKVQEEEKPL